MMKSSKTLFTSAELGRDPRLVAVVESHDRWQSTAMRLTELSMDAHKRYVTARRDMLLHRVRSVRGSRGVFRYLAVWSLYVAVLLPMTLHSTFAVIGSTLMMMVFAYTVYTLHLIAEDLEYLTGRLEYMQSAMQEADNDIQMFRLINRPTPFNSLPA